MVRAAERSGWRRSRDFGPLTELIPCCCGYCWSLKWQLTAGAVPPDSSRGRRDPTLPSTIKRGQQARLEAMGPFKLQKGRMGNGNSVVSGNELSREF